MPEPAMLTLQRLAGNEAVTALVTGTRRIPVAPAGTAHEREADANAVSCSAPALGPALTRRCPLAAGSGRPVTGAVAGLHVGGRAALDGVRLHADENAHRLTGALGAEAVTHGSDIFVSRDHYRPGTDSGSRLLAHELTHVAQSTGSAPAAGQLHLKRVKKHLGFLQFERKKAHITSMILGMMGDNLGLKNTQVVKDLNAMDHYGHWWVESGNLEQTEAWHPVQSWGWWPKAGVGIRDTLKVSEQHTVKGLLNQGCRNDPHHGEDKSKGVEVFHPVLEFDDERETDDELRRRVMGGSTPSPRTSTAPGTGVSAGGRTAAPSRTG
jgi:hypothetical protein